MPPKRGEMAQAVRTAFPEDASYAQVVTWSETTQGKAEAIREKAAQQRAATLTATYKVPDCAAQAPACLPLLKEYQELVSDVFRGAETIRTVISVRIPELKEEDNLGVAVQMTVIKQLESLQSKLMGGGGGDKDGGAGFAAGMFQTKDYLASRASVEDNLLGKEDSGDDKKKSSGSKSPSALLQLQQIDADALLRVELGAMQVATALRIFINTYALNWKKLIEPRAASSGRMVS